MTTPTYANAVTVDPDYIAKIRAELRHGCEWTGPGTPEDGAAYLAEVMERYPDAITSAPSLETWLAQRSGLATTAAAPPIVEISHYVEPGPQPWVIDLMVPEDHPSTLYGHAGSGKSYVGLDVAIRIVSGINVFGRAVKSGPVLYLDGELDLNVFLRRAHALARGHGLDAPPDGLFYRQMTKSLNDQGTRDEVMAFIQSVRPILTIVDSFSACLPGVDVNSLDDVTQRMRILRDLGTTLVIDHAAKAADMTGTGTPIGSAGKVILSRSMFQIAASTGGGAVLQHRKSSFGPPCPPIAFALTITEDEARVEQIEADDDRLEGVQKALPYRDRILAAFRSGEMHRATVNEVAAALEIPTQVCRNKMGRLRDKEHLLVTEGKVWSLAPSIAAIPFRPSRESKPV